MLVGRLNTAELGDYHTLEVDACPWASRPRKSPSPVAGSSSQWCLILQCAPVYKQYIDQGPTKGSKWLRGCAIIIVLLGLLTTA